MKKLVLGIMLMGFGSMANAATFNCNKCSPGLIPGTLLCVGTAAKLVMSPYSASFTVGKSSRVFLRLSSQDSNFIYGDRSSYVPYGLIAPNEMINGSGGTIMVGPVYSSDAALTQASLTSYLCH